MVADVLSTVRDKSSADNIQAMTQCFIRQLDPVQIFLFGSFADGSYTDGSDHDFYIVINDRDNVGEASDRAYKSIRYVQDRPVDIVVGTKSRFEKSALPRIRFSWRGRYIIRVFFCTTRIWIVIQ